MAQTNSVTPFDHEGLWNKAVLYINRATEPGDSRTPEERMLWASLSLELLAKSALAKINPLLVADPMDDGKSLLLAAGVGADTINFKTVAAKTAFSRCARAFPPFNYAEAMTLAGTRNEELHSAGIPFAQVHVASWWERFWAQAVILLTAQDRELGDLLQPTEVARAEEHLARNRENTARRAQALVERARQRFELRQQGRLSTRVANHMPGRVMFIGEYDGDAECPACGASGDLIGGAVLDSELLEDPEYGLGPEILTIGTDAFACSRCGLTLEGADLVVAAGIPETFEVEQEYEPEGEEYMNE